MTEEAAACRAPALVTCDRCTHVNRDGANDFTWQCELFPQNRANPVRGGEMPPYHRCRDVLRLTMANDHTPCSFFKPLPETGEPKIVEARGERSVTFPEKPNAQDRRDTAPTKET